MNAVAYARSVPSFSERVSALLDKVDYRPAVTEEERDAIYRLRYDAYLREGAIPPNFGRRLSDKYDDYDNAWLFGVFVDGALASSIRLHVSSPSHPALPATGVFGDVLKPFIDDGKTIIDPTRFVVDQTAAKNYPELPYVTVRIGWMAGEFFSADMILATVRVEHQAFYKRVFGHQPLCEAREYPSLMKPISMMSLDYFGMKERVHSRYPFFRSTYFERRVLFDSADVAVNRAPATVEAAALAG